MKKNLISVIILALVFANFVLTALLMFTVLPETKKANQMIEDVCSAIDLELNSGDAVGSSNVSIDKIEAYTLNSGETMTMSLAADEDGSSHYVVAVVSLSLNTESDNYTKIGSAGLEANESIISSDMGKIINQYTLAEFNEDRQTVYDAILSGLQDEYGKDFIVSVNFSQVMTQ